MMLFSYSRVLLSLAVLVCSGEQLTRMPAVRKVQLKYTCEIDRVPAGAKIIDLWIPMPSDNERQTVRLLNPNELRQGRINVERKFGNRLYYRRFEGPFGPVGREEEATSNRAPIKVELVYDIDVHEQRVEAAKKLVSTRQVTPGPELAAYLGDTKMIPIKGRISRLAEEIQLGDGEPLRAGRKIYDHLIDTMTYNYKAPGAGTGNAVWACDSKTGDCTDFHSVFIGVCRWRGIPADHVFGMPLPPDKAEGEVRHCHCWARFWVASIGWIPIDASRASKFPSEREYYFGTLGSSWVTLTHGRDIVLEPPQKSAPINMFESPFAEIDGQLSKDVHWSASYKERSPTR
jgi:transglutaminase-like putative cysteine protease